jgi:predicted transposase/invertase (TIGR01784 family)
MTSGKHSAIKPWEDLTIADDYMFKLVMRHPNICKRLIEKILNIKIKHIDYLDDEKSLKFRYSGKGIRLDVYVEGDDTIYDIEMQVRDYGDTEIAYRTRYYQSMIDVEALAAGTDYKKLKKSYIIFICPFALFGGHRHMYTFRNICLQDKTLELNDGTTKVFLCSDGQLDDVTPDIKAFLDYIKGLPTNDEFVNSIDHFIKEIKIKEEERVSYMTFAMKIQEAHDEGRAEGRAEGTREMAINTAIDMLRDNEPIAKIVKYSRLTEEQIRELASQIH